MWGSFASSTHGEISPAMSHAWTTVIILAVSDLVRLILSLRSRSQMGGIDTLASTASMRRLLARIKGATFKQKNETMHIALPGIRDDGISFSR